MNKRRKTIACGERNRGKLPDGVQIFTSAIVCRSLENGNYEVQVALTGEWKERDMIVTDKRLQEMVNNFNVEGRYLLFDFDHNSLWGGESKAAGWGRSMRVENGRIIVEMEATPAGRAAIENKEYRYLSPVYETKRYHKSTGKILKDWRMHSVALTNTPYLHELPAIINTANGGKMEELLKLLCVNTEDEAMAEVKRLIADNQTLASANSGLTGKVADLQVNVNKQEVEAAVNSGKLLPAQKELALALIEKDRGLYEQLISNSAAAGLTKEVPLPAGKIPGGGSDDLDNVTSYGELVNNSVRARHMYEERPERFDALYQAWMKGGK